MRDDSKKDRRARVPLPKTTPPASRPILGVIPRFWSRPLPKKRGTAV